jgi:hypothetical protein
MQLHGHLLAQWDLKVLESLRLMPPKWRQKMLEKKRKNTA